MVLTVPPRRMAKVGSRSRPVGAHQLGDDGQVGAVAAAGGHELDAVGGEAARGGGELARRARDDDLAGAGRRRVRSRSREAGRAPHAERVGVEDDGELHGSRGSRSGAIHSRASSRAASGAVRVARRARRRSARASARRPRRKQRRAAQPLRLAHEARVGQRAAERARRARRRRRRSGRARRAGGRGDSGGARRSGCASASFCSVTRSSAASRVPAGRGEELQQRRAQPRSSASATPRLTVTRRAGRLVERQRRRRAS